MAVPTTGKPGDGVDPKLREEVVEAATRHFNRHGYKSVTMDDIARALGRSKKTLYTVVSNKQELIDLVVDADMARDDAAVEHIAATATDAIDEMLQIARTFTEQMREVNPAGLYDLQKYYRPSWERLDAHHNDKMIEHVRANLRRGQAEGFYREDLHRELVATLFVRAPQAFLDQERFPLKQHDWDVVLSQFMLYHLNGIVNETGRAKLNQYLETTPNA